MKRLITLLMIGFIGLNAWCQKDIDMARFKLSFSSHPSGFNYIYSISSSNSTNGYWNFTSRFDDIIFNSGINNSNRRRTIFKVGEVEQARFAINHCFGVGTNNPQRKLHVGKGGNIFKGTYNSRTIASFENNNTNGTTISIIGKSTGYSGIFLGDEDMETAGQISYFHTDNSLRLGSQNSNNDLIINKDGNVGIGTTDPKAKLEVAGDIAIARTSKFKFLEKVNGGDRAYIRSTNGENGETYNSLIFAVGAGKERLFINGNNGYIGIGKKKPNYELDVCGTVRAKEVKVEEFTCSNGSFNGNLAANNITVKANGNTADFVFEEDYSLRELSEVENFIKTNKHLPDIPSATEMEEQGVNLAEMNKLLLQKVEELTLYSIGLEKARKREIEDRKILENQVTTLTERLEKIEKLLNK